MKTATERLTSLKNLLFEATRRQSHLAYEVDEMLEEWEGLGLSNGQRDDHAASILKRVQPHLVGLSEFFARCNEQCKEAIKDPFGRG